MESNLLLEVICGHPWFIYLFIRLFIESIDYVLEAKLIVMLAEGKSNVFAISNVFNAFEGKIYLQLLFPNAVTDVSNIPV